jgi:hypothetical protein
MRRNIWIVAIALVAFWAIALVARQGSSTQQPLTADTASNPDQELGRRFLIKAENLPPPKSGAVAASRSREGEAPDVVHLILWRVSVLSWISASGYRSFDSHALKDVATPRTASLPSGVSSMVKSTANIPAHRSTASIPAHPAMRAHLRVAAC